VRGQASVILNGYYLRSMKNEVLFKEPTDLEKKSEIGNKIENIR